MKEVGLAENAINGIENIFGKHSGFRRAHARGELYEAVFTPSGEVAKWTTAPHLQKEDTRAFVRFSHFSPNPTWVDIMSPVKGMAVQFQLRGGDITNIVGVNSPIFFAKTPEAFIEMLRIAKSFTRGKPSLREIKEFVSNYPESKAVIKVLKKMHAPASFATGSYHSNHAFYFIDGEGVRSPVKYEWEPAAGMETLSPLEAMALPIDFYKSDFEDRLASGPVIFQLTIILGEEGDPTDDPTIEWPAERKRINAGQLKIQRTIDEVEAVSFDPTIMTDGLACSEDQILHFRHAAYTISKNRRTENR
ncbi:MAG TPA: catalase family peroxidase [Planococcus sp. (in: firmicutes)]|nr:catalase family peroxidase [Planococcus sp. (in: firmicutes)]